MEIEFTSKDYFHHSTTTVSKKIKNLIRSPFCLALFSGIPPLMNFHSYKILHDTVPAFTPHSFLLSCFPGAGPVVCKVWSWNHNISTTCEHVRTSNSWGSLLPGDSYSHYSLKTTALTLLNCLQIPKSILLSLCKRSSPPTMLLPPFPAGYLIYLVSYSSFKS